MCAARDPCKLRTGAYQGLLGGSKECELPFDDLLHYQKIVEALIETIRLTAEIHDVIPSWPIEKSVQQAPGQSKPPTGSVLCALRLRPASEGPRPTAPPYPRQAGASGEVSLHVLRRSVL